MKKYRFPYKGSKNKLAEKIVKLFPDAENFYDLFCGGCSITHRALIENRWKNYVINDIDSRCPKLFLDAINGKFKNEKRWISREDFFKLKDIDPYVAFCWSFGNNGRDYLYARDLEPYKKAWHYALFFSDYTEAKKLLNEKIEEIEIEKDFYKKYLLSKQYIKHNPRLQSLESLERLERLERLEKLENIDKIITNATDYHRIKILPNSVIYCDIPYQFTNVYGNKKERPFNYKSFFDWCNNQTELCFISSYEMPEDFIPIAEFSHRSTLCATKNKPVIEKVFIPKHQLDLYKARLSACI